MKLHKKKYLIGIYDEYDNIQYVFDNARETARHFKTKPPYIERALSLIYHNHKKEKTKYGYIKFIPYELSSEGLMYA